MDAALILKTEAELDQTLYYLIGNSYVRVMVIYTEEVRRCPCSLTFPSTNAALPLLDILTSAGGSHGKAVQNETPAQLLRHLWFQGHHHRGFQVQVGVNGLHRIQRLVGCFNGLFAG